ncbi:MAG: hypothetical protein ABWY16_14265 [Pedobacter sp.]|uniref:hypothetical protein n=1 Tax=Pedobacter sp. TaxID=1411316 RepID=UPI00339A8F3B
MKKKKITLTNSTKNLSSSPESAYYIDASVFMQSDICVWFSGNFTSNISIQVSICLHQSLNYQPPDI